MLLPAATVILDEADGKGKGWLNDHSILIKERGGCPGAHVNWNFGSAC